MKFVQPAVGVCYPWLVTTNFIVDLATGTVTVGTGGAPALSVVCGDNYFTVITPVGADAFSMSNAEMVDTLFFGPNTTLVGVVGDTIGVFDSSDDILYVKFWGVPVTDAIKLPGAPEYLNYTLVSGVPVAVYYYNGSYYVSTSTVTRKLPYSGLGPLYASGDMIYIQHEFGVSILQITDVNNLTVRQLYYIPLPFPVSGFEGMRGDYLVIDSDGMLNLLNVNPQSPDFGSYDTVGAAVLTPVGYFIPAADTTYVITPTGIVPAPGYVVGALGDAVITNPPNTSTSVLYPLKTSVVVFTQPFTGNLYVDNYSIYLGFLSGSYRLPWGATLIGSGYTIYLNQPQIIYPPNVTPPPKILPTASVSYKVIFFPTKYVPVATFHNVTYVASGADKLLLIQYNQSVLYDQYGVEAVVPGTWLYGGVGEGCFVLYDGSALRVYDYAGNPLASYGILLPAPPEYITCQPVENYYEVLVFYPNSTLIVSPSGVSTELNPYGEFFSPGGLEAFPYAPVPHLSFNNINYTVQPGFAYIHINNLYATWEANGTGYILNVPQSTLYALLDMPPGAVLYPLSSADVALYFQRTGTVQIVPFASWVVQMCFLTVNTLQGANIYVNGVFVGNTTASVFTGCNYTVNVTVMKQYYRPATQLVRVVGPTTITLYPTPEITNVTLDILTPPGLTITSAEVNVNGENITWMNGGVESLISMPTKIYVYSYEPVDACARYNTTLNLTPGTYTLQVPCILVSPVLVMVSAVPVEVVVVGAQGYPVFTGTATPTSPAEVAVETGNYVIMAKPLETGYFPANFTVAVTSTSVYLVNVTPKHFGVLKVMASVPTASISVIASNGTTVSTGVGQLTAYLPGGKYIVMATASGYTPFSETVTVIPGENTTVSAILTPVVTPPAKRTSPVLGTLDIIIVVVVAAVAAAAIIIRRRMRRGPAVEEGGTA